MNKDVVEVFGRVGVLMGGPSAERAVSLESGAGVVEALRARHHHVVAIDWAPGSSLPDLIKAADIDVVWNALHGTLGEDGSVQGLLNCMGIPYTGSGVLACALAMDKAAAKAAFEAAGLRTPSSHVIGPGQPAELPSSPSLPVVVKPAREGSSVGVSIVREADAFAAAIEHARVTGDVVLVEQYIDGAEVAVGVLNDEALGAVEIRPAGEFYDYAAKYERDDTQYLVPPELPADVIAECESTALAAHRALGCATYSRVDFMVDKATNTPYLIEVNTLPGMTSHSLLPKVAEKAGYPYGELCQRILVVASEQRS